jgi:hypothetical protein
MSLGLTDTRETNIRGYLVERFDARPANWVRKPIVGAHGVTAGNRNQNRHISSIFRGNIVENIVENKNRTEMKNFSTR